MRQAVSIAAVLLSAALLFLLEPMFARMVLPRLGGSPAVWNTALVFYQVDLLAAYGYAHLLSRRLRTTHQILLHLGLVALALPFLPVAMPAGSAPPADHSPIPWLLVLLLRAIGLPFFVVAATAPLVQRWFAGSSHRAAGNPYFLYAASNTGSLGGLLAYPFVVEPLLRLADQSRLWSLGFGALGALLLGFARMAWRNRAIEPPLSGRASVAAPAAGARPPAPAPRRRLSWMLLAFVPSSLMMAVTTHITTDIAAVPLLWVVPIAIYLSTFILAFLRLPPVGLEPAAELLPLVTIALLLVMTGQPAQPLPVITGIHLLFLFLAALVCHGRRLQTLGVQGSRPLQVLLVALLAIPLASFASRPLRFGLAVAALLLAGPAELERAARTLHAERSFFGVSRVLQDGTSYHDLFHGTTLHGIQRVRPLRCREPLGYYGRTGPLGDVFRALRSRRSPLAVAVAGLGAGGIMAYSEPADRWSYYEIDPAVVRIATDPRFFCFLSAAAAPPRIVLGDARRSLAEARERYDVLILDAYSSDAIPVHLLTREALGTYLERLAPGGVLVFHISNQFFDLEPVVARLAADAGLAYRARSTGRLSPEAMQQGLLPSVYAVAARNAADLGALGSAPGWEAAASRVGTPLWTDDFSSLFSVLRR